MSDAARFLRLYDEQLRAEAETSGAVAVGRLGPLWLATLDGGRGFVTYPDLRDVGSGGIDGLVAGALDYFRGDPAVERVEWKTRGHDRAPGLQDALVRHGFVPEEPESIMIGAAEKLAAEVATPDGVTVRRVVEEPDVRAMVAMTGEAFGDTETRETADALVRRLRDGSSMQLWVAEADGRMVGAGRLEPVEDSDFAGLWGGGVLAGWRKRGIYRALTSVRAREALDLGKALVHSDSTEYSRPILERSGLVKVSTTTPYQWQR